MSKELEIKIVDGEYASEDDVQIEIVKYIPQPDRIEKASYSIKDIKKEIVEIDSEIEKKKERKQELLDIIKNSKTEVNKKIK